MTMRQLTASMFVTAIMASTGLAQQARTNTFDKSSWTDKVTIKGDIRYRYDAITDDSKLNSSEKTYTRQRDRLRARLDVEAKPSDTLKIGIGFSTEKNPVSGNQTLGDAWQKKDMMLNLGYFDWTLVANDPTSLNLVGGKQKNPFQPMGSCQDLVWDNDATPEGLVLRGQTGNEMITLGSNLGYMWIQERPAGNDDSMLYVGQGFVKIQPMPETALTLGGTYYDYSNIQGQNVLDWENKNNSYGNSTKSGSVSGSTTNKTWASEFKPIELFASLDVFVWDFPVSIFGQTVKNNDASTKFDSGFQYGISFGKAKNAKTFEVGYAYQELEKDAVLGALTDSDRWGGGTDGKGSKVYGKYAVSKNMSISLTYFMNDKTISDASKTRDLSRMLVDLVYSF